MHTRATFIAYLPAEYNVISIVKIFILLYLLGQVCSYKPPCWLRGARVRFYVVSSVMLYCYCIVCRLHLHNLMLQSLYTSFSLGYGTAPYIRISFGLKFHWSSPVEIILCLTSAENY